MIAANQAVRRQRGRVKLSAPSLPELDLSEPDISLERQVYAVLRKAFMAGSISAGAQLSSRSLAAALGVSSMPVREALKRLESDGVVEGRLKSAFVVTHLTRSEYRERLEVRLRLEGLLAREAALKITKAELKVVERLHRQMLGLTVSSDWDRLLSLNYRWHFEIYKCAKLPYALAIIENIWLKVGPALRALRNDYGDERVYEHHQAILDALAARDADLAEAALRRDLLAAADSVERLLIDNTP